MSPQHAWSKTTLLAWLCVCTWTFSACRPPAPQPDEQYRKAAEWLKNGETQLAWQSLSTKTKAAVVQKFKPLQDSGVLSNSENQIIEFFFTSKLPPGRIDEIQTLQFDDTSAVLAVRVGGQTTNQHLVLEDGQWKLDWASLLKPTVETP